jgi:hypothetical protein
MLKDRCDKIIGGMYEDVGNLVLFWKMKIRYIMPYLIQYEMPDNGVLWRKILNRIFERVFLDDLNRMSESKRLT